MKTILNILWLLVDIGASLLSLFAPIMFPIACIMALDGYNTHQTLLRHLQNFGQESEAIITSIDWENHYVFFSIPNETDTPGFAYLNNLDLYPPDIQNKLHEDQAIRIRYITEVIPDYYQKAVILESYPSMQKNLGIDPDMWILFWVFLGAILIKPQIAFIGFGEKFEDLLPQKKP